MNGSHSDGISKLESLFSKWQTWFYGKEIPYVSGKSLPVREPPKEPNCIWGQIAALVNNKQTFELYRKAVGLSSSDKYGRPDINLYIYDFIVNGYMSMQLMSIRKLCERYKKQADTTREILSLERLLSEIAANRELLSRNSIEHLYGKRSEYFDAICDSSGALSMDLINSMRRDLCKICKPVIRHANKLLFHSASATSIEEGKANCPRFEELTWGELWKAEECVCRVAAFAANIIAPHHSYSLSPVKAGDYTLNLDRPIIREEDQEKLDAFVSVLDKKMEDWNNWRLVPLEFDIANPSNPSNTEQITCFLDPDAEWNVLPKNILTRLGIVPYAKEHIWLCCWEHKMREIGSGLLKYGNRIATVDMVFGEEEDNARISPLALRECGFELDKFKRELIPIPNMSSDCNY